jgi:hypothetical protein
MRRLFLLGALLMTGCRSTVGPFQHRPPERVDDPRLTIPEQEREGRDRLALPQWSPRVAPTDPGLLPGPNGR